MALIDLITPEVVKVPLTADTKESVLEELVYILKEADKVADERKALAAIIEREQRGSTGLENGVAVPHAKTDTVRRLTIAIGISPKGVEFEALDGKPSHLFFLMLAPPDQSGPHIEALAEIARITRSRAFCDAMINANSSDAVVRLLREEY